MSLQHFFVICLLIIGALSEVQARGKWHEGFFPIMPINGLKHSGYYNLTFQPYDTNNMFLKCGFILNNNKGVLMQMLQRSHNDDKEQQLELNTQMPLQQGKAPEWWTAKLYKTLPFVFEKISHLSIAVNIEEGNFMVILNDKAKLHGEYVYLNPVNNFVHRVLNLPEVTESTCKMFDDSDIGFKNVASLDCYGTNMLALNIVKSEGKVPSQKDWEIP